MSYDRSIIGVVPVEHRDNANKIFEAIGQGPGTFSVALNPASGPASATPTHYTFHTIETEAMAIVFSAVGAGTLPTIAGDWTDYGTTEQDVQDAADTMDMHVWTGSATSPGERLATVMNSLALQQYAPEM